MLMRQTCDTYLRTARGIEYASPGTLDVPTRQQAGNTDRQNHWANMQHLSHARSEDATILSPAWGKSRTVKQVY